MDEGIVLKTIGRNCFVGSIPTSSSLIVSMVKRQSHLTVNQVFLVRVQVGTQTLENNMTRSHHCLLSMWH